MTEERIRIVAAALKRGGLIFSAPPPARHHTLTHEADRLFGDNHEPFEPNEQGFIGSDGRFYGREEAGVIAIRGGQIEKMAYGSQLFSEDLW